MEKLKKDVNDSNKEIVKQLSGLFTKLSNSIDQSYYSGQKSAYEEILIWLKNSYSITVGDNTDLTSKIICADNYDKTPNCFITGEYDYNTPGQYNLTYNETENVKCDAKLQKNNKIVLNIEFDISKMDDEEIAVLNLADYKNSSMSDAKETFKKM